MSNELTPLGGWLHQVEKFIRRFVVLTDDQAAAVALWVAHTHAFAAAIATPYLWISSAEMESGKTRLLEVLRLLVAQPWFTGRTTSAALTRKIDKTAPTLLLDESDAAFNGDREYAETLRGVLNTGYGRGGAVTVCTGQGANIDVKDFSTFCPKGIAGLGRLPDTVQSRSIPIRLKKRLASEAVERFRVRKARAEGQTIADGLGQFIEPIMGELEAAEPALPDQLSDRTQDVWEPLLAIADAAGGDWPDRARGAAKRLSGKKAIEDATLGVRLLTDIHGVFGEDEEQLPTHVLLTRLNALEESSWGSWNDSDGIRPLELANKLRPYEVSSRDIHVWHDGKRKTVKGYLRADFEDAWARYLPLRPDASRATRANGSNKPETALSYPRQDPAVARTEKSQKPHEQADGAGGAGRSPDTGEDGRPDELVWDHRHGPHRLPPAAEIEAKAEAMGVQLYDDEDGP